MMSDEEVVVAVRAFVESQFPKTCGACGKVFADLADYLRGTEHIGEPVSYDEPDPAAYPERPMGVFSYANCSCGTTMVIGSAHMDRELAWRLRDWIKCAAPSRGKSWSQVLAWVRAEIDLRVLKENPPRAA